MHESNRFTHVDKDTQNFSLFQSVTDSLVKQIDDSATCTVIHMVND